MRDNELHPYVIKDTGITVKIRKVSPFLMMELRKSFPPPEPPLNAVDYGEGDKRMEPNEASPEYQRQLKKYEAELQKKAQTLLIKRGIVVELTDDQKNEVAELRNMWKEEFGAEIEGDDKSVYITHIAVGTDSDLEELLTAITKRSQPTEGVIKDNLESFRN